MVENAQANITEAFISMLRTDYISLNDTVKLGLLSRYYVDYLGLLPEALSDTDQLIVGRRGTGKTTLLYRAFVACMESWDKNRSSNLAPRPRTLGIYVDLSKCQYIEDVTDGDYTAFEHAFVSEVCDSIADQLTRFWPDLAEGPGYFARLFKAAESNQIAEVRNVLDRIGELLREGLPRIVDKSAPLQAKDIATSTQTRGSELGGDILQRDLFELSLDLDAFVERSHSLNDAMEGLREYSSQIVRSRLNAYNCPPPEEILDEPLETYNLLSKSAMGVPRTLGIVLKQAWALSRQSSGRKIRKSDINYGVRYASTAYVNQLMGNAGSNQGERILDKL